MKFRHRHRRGLGHSGRGRFSHGIVHVTLAEAPIGCRCRIVRILNADPVIVSRFLEMGIVPGEEITIERLGPLGDPLEVSVKGAKLSLRRKEAGLIEVLLTN